MSDQALALNQQPLSQGERIVDTFVAPSKTFTDILRSASWWLPFVIIVLSTYVLAFSIQQKVGWQQVVENQIHSNPKAEEKMANLSPEQVAMQRKMMVYSFMGTFYAAPLTTIIMFAIFAVVLWPTINFVFGGSATFGRVLAVLNYAWLPSVIKGLIGAAMLWGGRSPDTFTMEGLVGSDPGYYIETPGALKTFLTAFDIFTIWTLVLLSIGLAIVAHKKRSAGFFAVFGWYALITLVKTAFAAIS